jgi:hypothetical protein
MKKPPLRVVLVVVSSYVFFDQAVNGPLRLKRVFILGNVGPQSLPHYPEKEAEYRLRYPLHHKKRNNKPHRSRSFLVQQFVPTLPGCL